MKDPSYLATLCQISSLLPLSLGVCNFPPPSLILVNHNLGGTHLKMGYLYVLTLRPLFHTFWTIPQDLFCLKLGIFRKFAMEGFHDAVRSHMRII